jgi:uncharacterized protein
MPRQSGSAIRNTRNPDIKSARQVSRSDVVAGDEGAAGVVIADAWSTGCAHVGRRRQTCALLEIPEVLLARPGVLLPVGEILLSRPSPEGPASLKCGHLARHEGCSGRRVTPPAASPEAALAHAVEHASHLLPAQGPIGNFVHHNTLHAFQHLSFHEAIAQACALHDASGYLEESAYREALGRGRILPDDLAYVVRSLPSEPDVLRSERDLRLLVMTHGLDLEPPVSLRWLDSELEVTRRFRPDVPASVRERVEQGTVDWLDHPELHGDVDISASLALKRAGDREAAAVSALWMVASLLTADMTELDAPASLRPRVGRDRTHRDLLVALGAADPAEPVNAVVVPFLSAYLDEGMARWKMPARDRGMLACFVEHLRVGAGLLPRWKQRTLRRLAGGVDAGPLCLSLLRELGVAPRDFDAYVPRLLLELPGWSGMVSRLEHNPTDRRPGAAPVSLMELLAIRLALHVEAVAESAARSGLPPDPKRLRAHERAGERVSDRTTHTHAFQLFQLAQLAGVSGPALLSHGAEGARETLAILERFSDVERRRALHEAYERRHLITITDAVAHNLRAPAQRESSSPALQIVFCIDDREEAIRRHVEEQGEDLVTFGTAGFFGVAMRFRALDDPEPAALCPVVVQPGHAVVEEPAAGHEATLVERRAAASRWGRLRFAIGDGSRAFVRGLLLTPVLGVLALGPLVGRVLFPRTTARLAARLGAFFTPSVKTELVLERRGEALGGLPLGFTVAERTARVRATLENIGLVRGFAPVVAILGHGATTINNPHHSAYDCGACGGRSGGPSARAFATMANDPAVREELRGGGIDIPDGTWFVGGLHDTTTDGVELFDDERAPASARAALARFHVVMRKARAMSAHERCRKFEHADADVSPDEALAHVEERAVDLSQARPELGHATNAVAVVGRRSVTRGLFLDRRSFLVSYDPSIDETGAILERILGAVVPVGAGINLEYYFSTVDGERFGCGTKLPHNVAGLLGVMEGSAGDLRTGLPRQMVEIHEPVRLLCLVEATPETILGVAARKAEVAELVTKGWVRLVSVDPETRQMHVFGADGFAPLEPRELDLPEVPSSREWYAGHLGFLGPAQVRPSTGATKEAA